MRKRREGPLPFAAGSREALAERWPAPDQSQKATRTDRRDADSTIVSRTLHPRQELLRLIGREDSADAALIALVPLTAAAPVFVTMAEHK